MSIQEGRVTAEDLAKCPRCGNYRQLIDLYDEAQRVGLSYPAGQPRFVIECCGYELSVESDELYKEIIALLQRHSASARTD